MSNLIDDHELQRLLDGSLPYEDRALLLQYADAQPQNWRRIALAFIEEQTLRFELSQLADVSSLKQPVETRVRSTPTKTDLTWSKRLSEAAVVCLMLGAAVWAGRMSVEQRDGSPVSVDPSQDYTVLVVPEASPSPSESVSLVSGAAEDRSALEDPVQQMLRPLFDQQTRGLFRDYGYTVNEEPVIYVVQGQQGEQYVVPQRKVSFVAHHETE